MASLAPFREREDAEETLARVEGLRERHQAGHGLPPIEIGDLEGLLRRLRIEGNVLAPEDFLSLGSLLAASRMAKRSLGEPGPGNPVGDLGVSLNPLPHLERSIEDTFEDDGSIKDRASPALRRIRRDREQQRERLRSRMEGLAAKLTQKDTAALVTLREGRYVLAVPQELRSRVDGLVLDRSGSGATFYLEPMEALDANNALRELEVEERAEIRRILEELTEKVRPERENLAGDWEHLGYLDTLRARVHLALRWGAEKPVFSKDGVRLRGARHPLLLEAREVDRDLAKARERVIPLDLELDDRTRILLITGPNMGGKTVALKTLGLLSALAQSGCFVPAGPGSEFPWIRRWVVSLGDEQSLEQDLSTFAAHLGRWGEALSEAGPGVLILLDELGSGTDPLEGAALAQSVLERLAEGRALGLVTTHLGSLKGFAASTEGIQNASMVFDADTREPTFRMRVGIPGESHALDMARRLGFPEERVARAEALLPQQERDVKELLRSLERERSQMSATRQDLDRALEEAERAREEHQRRLDKLLESRAELRARAARQARDILRRAEDTLKQADRAARKEQKERPPELDRSQLAREQARLGRLASPRAPRAEGRVPEDIRVGDVLWAPALGRKVEVVREMDGSGNVWVLSSGVRVSLPAKSLRVAEGIEPPPETSLPRPAQARPETEDAASDVDLRGLRVDECLEKLDRALDRALLSGLKELRVIHGKGTGALKEAVQSFCRNHSAVHGIRTAPDWQGGAGATLVDLEG